MAAMGITRIADITGLDRIGIPVAAAFRPNSRSLSVSQGKGLISEQAIASALMEAVEQFHAEDLVSRCRFASHAEIAACGKAAEPSTLPRSTKRLGGRIRIPWIEGFDVVQREPCWVPHDLVHTDFTLPAIPGSGYFLTSSNGLASGNHPHEAISAGLCEVIERDAKALWRAGGGYARAGRRLDLASVDDPICANLLLLLSQACVNVRVWDITSDIGIAVFCCHLRDESVGGTYEGSGCHPDRAIALIRAITEAAQSRLTRISGARDDLQADDYDTSPLDEIWEALIDIQQSSGRARRFATVPTFNSELVHDDVEWILGRLVRAEFNQVVVVDLTLPALRIPVVRVVVPGLEGPEEHSQYTPGRRAAAAARA
jgi:ribosomal protein S12 methylthiotransferase accessory factor